MQLLNNISESIAIKLNKDNPSFDILLAATIAKVIFDIIICIIKINESRENAYLRYKKMGPMERVIIKSHVGKYFPRNSKEHREVSKILIEEIFSKDTFMGVYKEVSEK